MRDWFVRNNGCTPQNPPEPAQGSMTHRVTIYAGCSAWLPGEVWKFFTQFQTSGWNADWTHDVPRPPMTSVDRG